MRIAGVWMVSLLACSKPDAPAPTVETMPSAAPAPAAPAPPPMVSADAGIAIGADTAPEVRAREPVPVDPGKARVRAELEEEGSEYAQALEAEGPGPSGEMNRRHPGADLNSQVAQIRREKGTIAGGGGGSGGAIAPGGAKVDPPATGGPAGRISVIMKSASEETSLTMNGALAKIQSAYMAGIKRCYKHRLADDRSLTGTVDLAFGVNETGRAVGGAVTGFDAAIDSCIEALTTAWRFPVPTTDAGTATTARFSFRFKLVPD